MNDLFNQLEEYLNIDVVVKFNTKYMGSLKSIWKANLIFKNLKNGHHHST